MMTILNEIFHQCGMMGYFILAGRDVDMPDDIMLMVFQTGKTALGPNFADAYPEIRDKLANAFNSFAHKCLGKPLHQIFKTLRGTHQVAVINTVNTAKNNKIIDAVSSAKNDTTAASTATKHVSHDKQPAASSQSSIPHIDN